jgi:hypothetical protein
MGMSRPGLVIFVRLSILMLLAGGGCAPVENGAVSPAGGAGSGNQIEVRDLHADPGNPLRLGGTWSASFDLRESHSLQVAVLSKADDARGNETTTFSFGMGGSEADGLLSGADGPVHTRVVRDAGTLTFDGHVAGGKGSGKLTFDADPEYVKTIADQTGETVSPEHALELALIGLPMEYVRKIESAGYKASVSDLISLRFAGVKADGAVAFHDAGYAFSVNDLRSLRFAGVAPEYAAQLKHAGYNLDANQLRALRFAGVGAEFAVELRQAGYQFSGDELRNLRFAGVSSSDAAELKKAGYNFSAEELRRLKFSGVSADYAVAAAVPGRSHLSADQLIHLRMRGVDALTLRKLRG